MPFLPPEMSAKIDRFDSPASPPKVLPTMYDLPSEDPEEPGLPDTFHVYQPRLLDETFCPRCYPLERIFTGSDVNLYYDPDNTLWYKRPDWYAVLDVPRLYAERDLRLSYVVWDEEVSPFIVVELLSPGTEKEDLGRTLRNVKAPPTKWEVYEQILRIPYYAIFDRYSQNFQAFKLNEGSYEAINIGEEKRFWLPEIQLGLGIWQGEYDGIEHRWLRWYDAEGWILTPAERESERAESERLRAEQEYQRAESERLRAESERLRAEQEYQRAESERLRAEQQQQLAESERLRAERLMAQLRALGIEPDGENV